MNRPPFPRLPARGRLGRALVAVVLVGTGAVFHGPAQAQESYQRISGEGSSWSGNAIDAMRVNVKQFGITVDYNPTGSTAGRKNFLSGTVDFAASDIPFQFEPEDGSEPERPAPNSYAYMPVTAGGTALMYNLKINGQRVTNLRLSGENVAKIFTGVLTEWNDPAIAADNPGLLLPARKIVPVVRSEGSGSTAQFTAWMIARHPALWQDYCERSGRAPKCGFTSFYPTIGSMIAQAGDIGVSGYVSQGFAEGAIGYVNYSYALQVQYPVAKVLNAAGYYVEPTPENVAVALLQARINTDESNPATYLTQDLSSVYTNTDPRNYELSSYSYFILPTTVAGQFNEAKGRTLGAFAYYAMCQAQQQSASLGYSPMPINLVEASFEQIRKIPGVEVQNINIASCKNPTFAPDGTNVLAVSAPQPLPCDRQGPLQCPDGTGGLSNVPTAVLPAAQGGVTPTPAPPGGAPPPDPAAPAAGGQGEPASGGAAAPGAAGAPAAAAGGSGGAAGAGTGTGSVGAAPAGSAGASNGSGTPSASAGSSDAAATTVSAVDPVTGESVGAVETGATGAECDPDTGLCEDTEQSGAASGPVEAAQAIGPVTPQTLEQAAGWGSTQILIVIVALLTVALVVAPAFAWRHFSEQRNR